MSFMEIENELTHFLDQYIKNSSRISGFNTYIYGKCGIPEKIDVDDETYVLLVRYPGYTCATVILSKKDDTVIDFLLIHRGGAFKGNDRTIFVNEEKLESLVRKEFVGKMLW